MILKRLFKPTVFDTFRLAVPWSRGRRRRPGAPGAQRHPAAASTGGTGSNGGQEISRSTGVIAVFTSFYYQLLSFFIIFYRHLFGILWFTFRKNMTVRQPQMLLSRSWMVCLRVLSHQLFCGFIHITKEGQDLFQNVGLYGCFARNDTNLDLGWEDVRRALQSELDQESTLKRAEAFAFPRSNWSKPQTCWFLLSQLLVDSPSFS